MVSDRPTPAAAANMPIELFYLIVDHFYKSIDAPSEQVPVETIRALGNLALVSRYCARVLRFFVLRDVYLQNLRKTLMMSEVLHVSPVFEKHFEAPASLIRRVYLVYDTRDHLWLSRATLFVAEHPIIAKQAVIYVIIRSPDSPHRSTSLIPGSSLFYGFPRAVPSLFKHILKLELYNIRFRLRSHFVKLVSEFRNLQWLHIDNLHWEDESSQESLKHWPVSLEDIVIRERDRYSHGGRGALPLILMPSVTFPAPRIRAREQEGLPRRLRTPRQRPGPFYPAHPEQHKHLGELIYIFYAPGVAEILDDIEFMGEVEWHITRLQRTRDPGSASELYELFRRAYSHTV